MSKKLEYYYHVDEEYLQKWMELLFELRYFAYRGYKDDGPFSFKRVFSSENAEYLRGVASTLPDGQRILQIAEDMEKVAQFVPEYIPNVSIRPGKIRNE